MAGKYPGKIPRGYELAFENCTRTAASQYAQGARAARFGKTYDRSRAKVIKVGLGKFDHIVVMKKSPGRQRKPIRHPH